MNHAKRLNEFRDDFKLDGLSESAIIMIMNGAINGYTVEKGKRFLKFQKRIDNELLKHSVITNNEYTKWFAKGNQTPEQINDLIVQFSVFSNWFPMAQYMKMLAADTIEGMEESKEILANEIGVVFNDPDAPDVGEEKLATTKGSIEGGKFRHRAAHFHWLLTLAKKAGLEFNDVGKKRHGSKPTLEFVDELFRLYGNEDYMTGMAASYAVENWAAAGFWKELIAGFEGYNDRTGANLPTFFFTHHDKLEAQHAAHTQEELEELYFSRDIDEDDFIRVGNEMLSGVQVFWDGLNKSRGSGTKGGIVHFV